jgi:hypothetical protein
VSVVKADPEKESSSEKPAFPRWMSTTLSDTMFSLVLESQLLHKTVNLMFK